MSKSVKKKKQLTLSQAIVLAVMALTTVVALVMGGTAAYLSYKSATDTMNSTLPGTADMAATGLENDLRRYRELTKQLADREEFFSAEATAEDRSTLLAVTEKELEVSSAEYYTLNGVCEETGANRADTEYFKHAAAGETYVNTPDFYDGSADMLVYFAAPVWENGVKNSKVVGVVALAEPQSILNDVTDSVKTSANSTAYVIDKAGTSIADKDSELVKTKWNAFDAVATDSGLAALVDVNKSALTGTAGVGEYSYDGLKKDVAFCPIDYTDGWAMVVAVPYDDSTAEAESAGVICLVLVVVALLLGYLVPSFMTKDLTSAITKIIDRMNRFSKGDLISPMPEMSVGTYDMSTLRDCMITTIDHTSGVIEDVRLMLGAMASGDFSVDSAAPEKYVGDYAEILAAENKIKQDLAMALTEILTISEQVSAGSEQVSNGAQTLAQGATEQASSVEQLSATVGEVARQIKESASEADKARALTVETGVIMDGTVGAMSEARNAMDEITSTSHDISKVIKTIDDIAFQTNILALNAAVEAARAGAAGKGFAVVADEVRNLSQKSAEAAKNTTSLIETSITAVEKGGKLVGKASDDFAQVAQKSGEVNNIVCELAEQFQQQAVAANQLSLGIEQVASVVQMNSATSEESAAASEELSSQAGVLKSLVEQFKLSGDSAEK